MGKQSPAEVGKASICGDIETGRQSQTLMGPGGRIINYSGSITSVTFSPDGKTIASGSGNWSWGGGGYVILWDVHTGKPKQTLIENTNSISSVAFSPDGKTLAAANWERDFGEEIYLWDVETGILIQTFISDTDTEGTYSVAFSPDGKTIASGSEDAIIRLWDIDTSAVFSTEKTNPHRAY